MTRVAVVGLGLFGMTLAKELSKLGAEVVALDEDMEMVEDVKDFVTDALCLDITDERALHNQSIAEVDVAVVGIGQNFEGAQLATVYLKKMGIPKVVARATSPLRARILELVGADHVINPEDDAAKRLAKSLMLRNVTQSLELSKGHSMVEIEAPVSFWGKTIGELDLRNQYEVNLVAIKRRLEKREEMEEESVEINDLPRAGDTIRQGDRMMLVGRDEQIHMLTQADSK